MSSIENPNNFSPEPQPVPQEAGFALPLESESLENIERERLYSKINRAIDNYASDTMRVLNYKVTQGEDRDEIREFLKGNNTQRDYKEGDSFLNIDPIGENMLHGIIRDLEIPAVIHGEHQTFPSPTGEAKIHFAIDPFDNTTQYKLRQHTPVYTVLSAYHPDGTPIASFVGNIRQNTGYFLQGGNIYEKHLDTGVWKPVNKSNRKSLREDDSVLASFTGSSEYSSRFYREFNDFIAARPSKAYFSGEGGAFIYGNLASGITDAYVMFDEPYEEIDPGAAIALAAGCVIGHYDLERNEWVDYKYDPNREEKTVSGLFIAAATPEIRDEILDYYKGRHLSLAN